MVKRGMYVQTMYDELVYFHPLKIMKYAACSSYRHTCITKLELNKIYSCVQRKYTKIQQNIE